MVIPTCTDTLYNNNSIFKDRALNRVKVFAHWSPTFSYSSSLNSSLTETLHTEGAFTPDANEANKWRYLCVVGCLNILSLLASFAREIHFICAILATSFVRIAPQDCLSRLCIDLTYKSFACNASFTSGVNKV